MLQFQLAPREDGKPAAAAGTMPGAGTAAGAVAAAAGQDREPKRPTAQQFMDYYFTKVHWRWQHTKLKVLTPPDLHMMCPKEEFLQKKQCKNKKGCWNKYKFRHSGLSHGLSLPEARKHRLSEKALCEVWNSFVQMHGMEPEGFAWAVLRKELQKDCKRPDSGSDKGYSDGG